MPSPARGQVGPAWFPIVVYLSATTIRLFRWSSARLGSTRQRGAEVTWGRSGSTLPTLLPGWTALPVGRDVAGSSLSHSTAVFISSSSPILYENYCFTVQRTCQYLVYTGDFPSADTSPARTSAVATTRLKYAVQITYIVLYRTPSPSRRPVPMPMYRSWLRYRYRFSSALLPRRVTDISLSLFLSQNRTYCCHGNVHNDRKTPICLFTSRHYFEMVKGRTFLQYVLC